MNGDACSTTVIIMMKVYTKVQTLGTNGVYSLIPRLRSGSLEMTWTRLQMEHLAAHRVGFSIRLQRCIILSMIGCMVGSE